MLTYIHCVSICGYDQYWTNGSTVYHLHILIQYNISTVYAKWKSIPHVGFLPAVNPNHLQQSPAKKLKSRILPQTCHDTMCFVDRQDQPWRTLWAVYLWSLRMFDGNDICSLRPFWWFDYWSMFSWCVSSGHVVLMDGWMLRQIISKKTW